MSFPPPGPIPKPAFQRGGGQGEGRGGWVDRGGGEGEGCRGVRLRVSLPTRSMTRYMA